MRNHSAQFPVGLWIAAGVVFAAGCQESQPAATTSVDPAVAETSSADSPRPADAEAPRRTKRTGPVTLGGAGGPSSDPTDDAASADSILAALQPLQVLLGKWNGTSRKAVVDQPEWIWDFQTDPNQPALVLKSDKGEYLREARLTYQPESRSFQLTAVDHEEHRREFHGTFTDPVQDIPGDNNTLQRTFKLQLTETQPLTKGEVWQIVFAQQENNRYIVEVNRQRGAGAFARIDTIHTQREGTSFAVSATDYGEKTCIISQGLGTIPVSHQGRSYWVCCTGCKAAFEEDPQKWIAKYEARKKMQP